MFSFSLINCGNLIYPKMRWTFLIVCLFQSSFGFQVKHLPMLMPNVQPTQKDTYLCTAFKMPQKETEYVIEFLPNATMATAHHILIYGCKVPGYYERDTPRAVWDCGEMSSSSGTQSAYRRSSVCSGASSIIYAWAMDAPELILPQSVGFKVGKGTDINFLVLQVHYAHVDKFIAGETDSSGITLSMVPGHANIVTKRAGVLLLGTSGLIPANSYEHMETTCTISQPIELHPFAFRTHTHKLGKVVSGWFVRDGNWQLIGKHDPQKPQMFYPISEESIVIKQGDIVAARCTMDNYLPFMVSIGSTGDDEMCNFYLMYWVDGDDELHRKYCFSPGPPLYYWSTDPLLQGKISNAVDRMASEL